MAKKRGDSEGTVFFHKRKGLWCWLRFAKMLARGRVGKRWAIRRVKWLWRGRKRRRWW